MKREIILYIIIAFLLGVITSDFSYAKKIPDIILPSSVQTDLKEQIDNIINVLNNGKYVMTVSDSAILSTDELDSGALLFDDSNVSKYLIVSNGTTNYRVEVTAIP